MLIFKKKTVYPNFFSRSCPITSPINIQLYYKSTSAYIAKKTSSKCILVAFYLQFLYDGNQNTNDNTIESFICLCVEDSQSHNTILAHYLLSIEYEQIKSILVISSTIFFHNSVHQFFLLVVKISKSNSVTFHLAQFVFVLAIDNKCNLTIAKNALNIICLQYFSSKGLVNLFTGTRQPRIFYYPLYNKRGVET